MKKSMIATCFFKVHCLSPLITQDLLSPYYVPSTEVGTVHLLTHLIFMTILYSGDYEIHVSKMNGTERLDIR